MGLVGVGIALAVLGLILVFTNILGFIPGVPLLALGIVLIVAGLIVALVRAPFRMGAGGRRGELPPRV